MEFVRTILRTLRKPFPAEESWWTYTKKVLVLSLFISFFLFVFKPFGIDSIEEDSLLICLGFGAMTFAGAFAYELTIGQVMRLFGFHINWTFSKWIVNTLITTLFIAFANFIFSRLIVIGYIDWSLFPTMLYSTFMIGVLPVTLLGAWLLSKQETKYKGIADEINQNKAGSPKSTDQSLSLLDIPTGQIKYIEALQNYVKIGYLNAEGELQIQTERLTLKEVLAKIHGSPITKCHRSYLVNTTAIISVSGNAQGLLLSLSDCEKMIPVSRTYVPHFRA